MALGKKYIEDFEVLCRDFEKLKKNPNPTVLGKVVADLQQLQNDMKNVNF